MCNYASIKFLTWPHEPDKDSARPLAAAGNSHVRSQLKNGFCIFFYRNVALHYVSQDFGRNT